ncbi:MAG: VWA domain-containing protein [Syntrophomonadaceae bacterium]|nr:VWA domain-containing protein [Syntrophomonadaceae bacterium]
MFNKQAYYNEELLGISFMEILGGDEESPEYLRFVPLKHSCLKGEIYGPLASLELTQIFSFTSQQCSHVIETRYNFPLPGDAAVTAVKVYFGGVEIVTELKEREQAEDEYQKARSEGRQAVLVSRQSPDVFSLHLSGIEPDQDIRVVTNYVQLARPAGIGWTITIPLTIAPRFVRQDEKESRYALGQPLGVLRDPGHRFSMELNFFNNEQVDSSQHALTIDRQEAKTLVRLRQEEIIPDRDLQLRWFSPQEARAGFPCLIHNDPDDSYVYFLSLISPPQDGSYKQLPRETILLLDHSGSMTGDKWKASDWAVMDFISHMQDNDMFNLGIFHDMTTWFARHSVAANPKNIKAAKKFLKKHQDSGGTQLGIALEQALQQKRSPGELVRNLLIITDAQVTDTSRLLQLVDQERKKKNRMRVSVLCIDAAPNSFLANDLAERGGGSVYYLTSDPGEKALALVLDEIMEEWKSPVLSNLCLEITANGIQTNRNYNIRNQGDCEIIEIGDLVSGRSKWVVGRFLRDNLQNIKFRLLNEHGSELVNWEMVNNPDDQTHPQIKSLFGAGWLLRLEDILQKAAYKETCAQAKLDLLQMGFGTTDSIGTSLEGNSLYRENKGKALQDAVKEILVQESLQFGLPCSETSFIGVRKEQGKKIEKTVVVANALPSGWHEDFCMDQPMVYGFISASCFESPPFKRREPRVNQLSDLFAETESQSSIGENKKSSAKETARLLIEIRSLIPDLQRTSMSLEDFNTAVNEGRLSPRPGLSVSDHCFEKQNPHHPLAASNRFIRIDAADKIMDLAKRYGQPLPADILEVLHQSLFDCSAAVRHSIAGALFLAGNQSSIPYLDRLLEQEEESVAVRLRVKAALIRIQSPFVLPENVPQIVVVLDNLCLVEELMELAEKEEAQLRHARPGSPDIFAFSADVKIIDRPLLGEEAWEDFCAYLAEVNSQSQIISNIPGDFSIEGSSRDDTPLIIVDNLPYDSVAFSRPPTNSIYRVPVWNSEEICRIVKECIQNKSPVSQVRAVNPCDNTFNN